MALSLELQIPINCMFSQKRFPVCFNLFVLLSLVTPVKKIVAFGDAILAYHYLRRNP